MGVRSFFLLGAQFLLHWLAKLAIWRPERGIDRFLQSYAPDDIRPTTPAEGESLVAWLRCTNCGLCDAVCPLDSPAVAPDGLSFAQLAYGGWRDLTVHKRIAMAAASLSTCEQCGACEAVCPEAIPLRDLARAVAR